MALRVTVYGMFYEVGQDRLFKSSLVAEKAFEYINVNKYVLEPQAGLYEK